MSNNENDNSETSNKKKAFTVSLLVVALGVVVNAMWPEAPRPSSSPATVDPVTVNIEPLPAGPVNITPLPVEPGTSTPAPLQTVSTVAVTPPPKLVTPAFMVQLSKEATTLLAALQVIDGVRLSSQLESEKAAVRGFKNEEPLENLGMGTGMLMNTPPVAPSAITAEAAPHYSLLSSVQLRSLITSNGKTTARLGVGGEIIQVTANMKLGPLTVNRITAQGVQLSEAGKTRWLRPYISATSTSSPQRQEASSE